MIWTIGFKIKAKIEVRKNCIACHFADEFVFVGCVGHMFFKCDEMCLSLSFYCQNLSCFTEMYLSIHVKARLASNGALNKMIWLPHDSPPF